MKMMDIELAQEHAQAALDQPVFLNDRREVTVLDVIASLQRAGVGVFIIGGAPRDWLMGQPGKDIDLSVDRPLDEARKILRDAYPRIDAPRMRNERFGVMRWADATSGGIDINILRSWKDIRNDDMWSTTFVARTDLIEDALMRDFSINAFYYDCAARSLLDPLGCGVSDIRTKTLRLITHRRVLDTSYRTTFRIIQFLCRGYSATDKVVEHLERSADRDIQGMGARIHQWIPGHIGACSDDLAAFERLIYRHAREPASIATLDSFFHR
jgi:poly(A) polymerase